MPTSIIFGDVHGISQNLQLLIREARARWGEVTLYGLGDYIDRGPDSKGVVQICIDEGVQGILGNHELWLHQLLSTGVFNKMALTPIMGGTATLDSYGIVDANDLSGVPKSHREFLLGLPLFRSVEVAGTTYWLTHAGIGPSVGEAIWNTIESQVALHKIPMSDIPEKVILETVEQVSPESILWPALNPEDPQLFRFRSGSIQVFGHTPMAVPTDGGHFIALDTGCGRKRGTSSRPNCLSGVALHEDGSRTLFSVGA